jgi:peptide/nickel transport system substrate-binding protein
MMQGYHLAEKQKDLVNGIRRLRVIKPVIQLSTNASYVDIGEFCKGMAKNRIRRAGTSVLLPLYANLFLPEKFLFFRASWIADYPDAELSIPILQ